MSNMWKEIQEQPDLLKNTITRNISDIKSLADEIDRRGIRFIAIAARGTSDNAAVYAKYVFELLVGIPVMLAAPSIFTIYNHTINFKDSMVIGISQSGMAKDVLEVLNAAKAQGGLTVSITNSPESPLAIGADWHLCCFSGVEAGIAATKTFTAQAYIIVNLALELANKNSAKAINNEGLADELSIMPDKTREVIKDVDAIDEIAKRYRLMNDCIVLARGVNYAIALECAIKIMETSYVRAKAYSTSDFYHGPLALVESNTPVVLFAPDGPTIHDTRNMAERLTQIGADLLVISNDSEMLKSGTVSISVPYSEYDIVSFFYNTIAAQILAYRLTIQKGMDPDNPRNIKKITITY